MSPRSLLFAALGLVLLAGLFLFYRPEPATVPVPVAAEAVVPPEASAPVPSESLPTVYAWRVEKANIVSAPGDVRVRQGETLVLQVLSDHADELHLHGYDLALKLQAGVPGQLEFKALHTGRFEMELHHSHRELGVIEVLP